MNAHPWEDNLLERKVESDLKAAGYKVATYVSPGTAHEFQTWRRSLYQMAPLLFK